ncbi:hypothetical protein [Treponema sp.]|uniref:hypothetical protein n=1 Tax=Treponema sp. TaxID=166 RepID=UPI00298EAEBF|nr:hypothetical protein [Treponema sp.]
MLCAKYDYKMDIAVKKEEAFQDGKEAGIAEGITQGVLQGTQQKAIEAAEKALEMNLTVEQAAEITGLPLEQVLELKKQVTVNA